MQITLANGYYIEIDERNHTLKQKYEGKTKEGNTKEMERICGYYGKLDQALEEFLKQNQGDCAADTAMEMRCYAQFVNQANKEAVEALKTVLGVTD